MIADRIMSVVAMLGTSPQHIRKTITSNKQSIKDLIWIHLYLIVGFSIGFCVKKLLNHHNNVLK